MDTIILAGGKGNRMEDVLPKPLVRVKNKAILAYQLDYLLKSKQIEKIILSLGYKADEIIDYVKVNYPDYPIDFVVETEPLGTAGAFKQALVKANSGFILGLNCDDITDIDIENLSKLGANTICVAHPQLPFGLVKENNGYAEFLEKPILDDWVSCGWYVFNKNELLSLLPKKGSLEYEVFPKIKLKLYKHEGFWQPLNSKKDILVFESLDLPQSLSTG
ncbi:MAG: nucleotidyltransferase family protein [Candidatus Parcubacteria bacterium]|nr:nucleotidyltransferase family protein [Candidatus Parcubacteria bacterium]